MEAYFLITISADYIALGPWLMQADGKVVIFPDVDVPYVLRPFGNGCHKILDQAYVLASCLASF
jgi:hypothetical protein